MAPQIGRLEDRLWPRVLKTDSCWMWQGAKSLAGYGVISKPGRHRGVHYVHRLVYELLVGPIPDGLVIDHLCETPACCNPDHLEPVTHCVNIERGKRGRKTTCPHGHPLDGMRRGMRRGRHYAWRFCRTCEPTRRSIAR